MHNDVVRRIFVSLALIFCILGSLIGSGVLGTAVEDSPGGNLSDDSTLLAPAGPAFSVWSVIYVGLFIYAVWQWFPSQADHPRHRAVGWLAGLSMVLNALWLLVVQQGWIWISVLVIIALLLTLVALVHRLQEIGPTGGVDSVVTDVTFGLYLGWVTLATCANIAAAGASSDWDFGELGNRWVAVAVIIVAAAVGLLLARRFGARFAVAITIAWGLAWIAVGRLTDEPHDTTVGIAAIIAVFVVLVGTALLRRQTSPTPIRKVQ